MSEALAAEKARFYKMAETMVHDLKNKMIILNLALKRAESKKEKGGGISGVTWPWSRDRASIWRAC